MLLAHVAQLVTLYQSGIIICPRPTVSVKIIQNLNSFDRNSEVEIFNPLLVKYFHSQE